MGSFFGSFSWLLRILMGHSIDHVSKPTVASTCHPRASVHYAVNASAQSPTGSLAREADEGVGLPAWIYHDPDFFALEKRSIFRTSWQLVCHANDIPEPGDYHALNFLGESIVVVRGADRAIRSFHNVCRHRVPGCSIANAGAATAGSSAPTMRGLIRSIDD